MRHLPVMAFLCGLFLLTVNFAVTGSPVSISATLQDPDPEEKTEAGDGDKGDVLEQSLEQQRKILTRRVQLRIADIVRTLELDADRESKILEGAAAVAGEELGNWARSGPGSQVMAWGGAPRPPASVVLASAGWKRLLEEVLTAAERERYDAAREERRQRLLKVRLQLMLARLDIELLLSDEQRTQLLPVLEKVFSRPAKSRSALWRNELLGAREELAKILSARQLSVLEKRGRQ